MAIRRRRGGLFALVGGGGFLGFLCFVIIPVVVVFMAIGVLVGAIGGIAGGSSKSGEVAENQQVSISGFTFPMKNGYIGIVLDSNGDGVADSAAYYHAKGYDNHNGIDLHWTTDGTIISPYKARVKTTHTGCSKTFQGDTSNIDWSKQCPSSGLAGAGNYIILEVLDHPELNGKFMYIALCHLSSVNVSVGQEVEQGQVLGVGGESGNASGPHLHLQVWTGPADQAGNYMKYEVDPIIIADGWPDSDRLKPKE